MKKLLLSTITILVIILTGITVVKGLKIGNIEILGIMQIKEKNEELDTQIEKATKLASIEYQKKIDNLEDTAKKLETQKNTYLEMVDVSTDSEIQAANQIYNYDYDFLWVRIGNHAKSEGVKMTLALTKNASGLENVYNINFTVTGTYIGIAEFITDIEDDDRLGFKIEDYKMTATSSEDTNTLQATFNCKNIKINGIVSSSSDTTN